MVFRYLNLEIEAAGLDERYYAVRLGKLDHFAGRNGSSKRQSKSASKYVWMARQTLRCVRISKLSTQLNLRDDW
jgi:hypothetical protein